MDAKHAEFFNGLSQDEKQLFLLRDELYEGDWSEMVRDLNGRRDGKPYIYKLITQIEEELDRIERLRRYEAKHDVDLGPLAVEAFLEES